MSGRLIVIEGLDGSGKATQSDLLYKRLAAKKKKSLKITFPDYNSDSSALVKMYLSGEFGKDPNDVNAYAASSFYAVDRYASYKKDWEDIYQSNGIIIADRYTTSNAIHQCSKLPEEEWDEYLNWLFDFEYKMLEIPEPNMIIYLQMDPEVSQKLMTSRYHGDERKKDIHETNLGYLKKSQKAADYCAQKLGWKIIHCTSNGKLRSIEEIQDEIIAYCQLYI